MRPPWGLGPHPSPEGRTGRMHPVTPCPPLEPRSLRAARALLSQSVCVRQCRPCKQELQASGPMPFPVFPHILHATSAPLLWCLSLSGLSPYLGSARPSQGLPQGQSFLRFCPCQSSSTRRPSVCRPFARSPVASSPSASQPAHPNPSPSPSPSTSPSPLTARLSPAWPPVGVPSSLLLLFFSFFSSSSPTLSRTTLSLPDWPPKPVTQLFSTDLLAAYFGYRLLVSIRPALFAQRPA